MAWSPQQLQTAQIAVQRARRRGANEHEILALLEGGIVEKNLIHTAGGDRDSGGFLQQRVSQGWGPFISGPRGIRQDTDDFLKRAMALRGKGLASGKIAALVQRPAAQYAGRYAEHRGDAVALLRQLGGGGDVAGGGGGGGQPGSQGASAASDGSSLPGASGGTLALLQALQAAQGASQPASSGGGLQAPAASAAPPLPQGLQVPVSGGGPAPKPDASALLSMVRSAGEATPGTPAALTPDAPAKLPETHGGGAGAALSWASSKLGFKETGGENRGGLADRLNKRFGMSGQPWCAMFTSAAVVRGGAPLSARTASVAQVREKAQAGEGYQRGLVPKGRVQAGDLILFGNSHIGMVQAVHNGRVRYIGGNQSDGVTIGHTTLSGGDFVRPRYGARRRGR